MSQKGPKLEADSGYTNFVLAFDLPIGGWPSCPHVGTKDGRGEGLCSHFWFSCQTRDPQNGTGYVVILPAPGPKMPGASYVTHSDFVSALGTPQTAEVMEPLCPRTGP